MGCWEQKTVSMLKTAFFNKSFLLGVVAICSCQSKAPLLPFYNSPDFTPIFCKNESEINKNISHRIDTFNYTNQFNKTITNKTLEGKIHVANFFFTSCGSICPKMMNNLKLVNTKFATDTSVAILSYTVTPWVDNVDRLKKYHINNLADAQNWHLLTGNKASIYQLARQSYFAEQDIGFTKDSTEFLHTEHFLLVDKSGRLRGIYNGTLQLEAEQLIKDIAILKNEN
jgi:protein SCO1